MKKVMISLLLGIFLISFAFAANGNQDTVATQYKATIQAGNLSQDAQQVRGQLRENFQEGRELEGQLMELKKTRIQTRINLTEDSLNASKLRAKLSNGRNAEIKIMPETASARALERLNLKRCNDTSINCSIELKEVGQGNETRLVYEAKARKTFRILGIFKNKEDVSVEIDAETGEEISRIRPWWAWMASERDEAEEIESE